MKLSFLSAVNMDKTLIEPDLNAKLWFVICIKIDFYSFHEMNSQPLGFWYIVACILLQGNILILHLKSIGVRFVFRKNKERFVNFWWINILNNNVNIPRVGHDSNAPHRYSSQIRNDRKFNRFTCNFQNMYRMQVHQRYISVIVWNLLIY